MADPYTTLLRPLLFSGLRLDPEWLHSQSIQGLSTLAQSPKLIQELIQRQFSFHDSRLRQTCWGLRFANPLGLAAGFDKDGQAVLAWPLMGFGFCELGTVTYHPQPGNSRPRLFRLPRDAAALNRMGFNNLGATALAKHLQRLHVRDVSTIPIGLNLGKSKITSLDAAADDYLASFERLQGLGDYFVINVSSPNTPGLRSLQAAEQLEPILSALQAANTENKPLLLKIAPDLAWEDIRAVVELAQYQRLSGIIATNTTLDRTGLQTQSLKTSGLALTEEPGGISGRPLRQRSTEVIRFIWRESRGRLPIIGVGGVFTAADAWEKLTAGACLLQVYTGWIYEGPWMVKRILTGLLERIEAQNLPSIEAAVGLEHRC